MNFTLFGVMCHGAWRDQNQRSVLTDPEGKKGRITIVTQTKAEDKNNTGSPFESYFKYYIMQGRPLGEAIRFADDAVKNREQYNPEVWRSGPRYEDVTHTAEIDAPRPPDTQVA